MTDNFILHVMRSSTHFYVSNAVLLISIEYRHSRSNLSHDTVLVEQSIGVHVFLHLCWNVPIIISIICTI